MPSPQRDVAEHDRQEGLGRRVRRFVGTEWARALDKGEQQPGIHSSTREDEDYMGSAEVDQVHASHAHDASPWARQSDSVQSHADPLGSADRPTGENSAQRVGLLNDTAGLREQWQGIQAAFVDDPQRAVDEAGALVDRTLDQIRTNVGSARRSESMSTEDLRVSFQRYREFFQRLLSA